MLAAVIALWWANSAWSDAYEALWLTELQVSLGSATFGMDLRHWVNEGLMTLFFLVVGLEIKRELVEGELRERSRRNLPIAAALGGMVVPALIYAFFNAGGEGARGWGIPMATDIALAVGVLSLGGRSVRAPLKLFLLALAIVDDVGAIVVIALFYTDEARPIWLLAAAAVIAAVLMARRLGVEAVGWYVVIGTFLWFSLRSAGVHATLAGVALGLLAPAAPSVEPDLVDVPDLRAVGVGEVLRSSREVRRTVSVIERLEHHLHGWTSFLVVPLFALANAGINIGGSFGEALGSNIGLGVLLGLVVGKPLGIVLFSWLAVRARWATLPVAITWTQIAAVAVLAGIGFTVSLFIAELALVEPAITTAKSAILFGSTVAALLGLGAIKLARRA